MCSLDFNTNERLMILSGDGPGRPSFPSLRSTPGSKSRLIVVLILLALGGCAPSAPVASPSPAPAEGPLGTPAPDPADVWRERAKEVHWSRSAAEYRALAVQVYRSASDRLREVASDLPDGRWGVIMDADETILDNSEFQRRLVESGAVFEESAWDAWVLEEDADLVPGAAEFIELVQELGGRVAVVTNRHQGICAATLSNLHELGVRPAVVLCETKTSQKEERFRMVQEGRATPELPPLRVVMWIGDNIGDFPDLQQSLRDAPTAAFDEFGRTYFVIPNPMYGSWLGNEWR